MRVLVIGGTNFIGPESRSERVSGDPGVQEYPAENLAVQRGDT
jgi:hypothetical protein